MINKIYGDEVGVVDQLKPRANDLKRDVLGGSERRGSLRSGQQRRAFVLEHVRKRGLRHLQLRNTAGAAASNRAFAAFAPAVGSIRSPATNNSGDAQTPR
jgi:hypothetical protein